jgi:hypothetical protein
MSWQAASKHTLLMISSDVHHLFRGRTSMHRGSKAWAAFVLHVSMFISPAGMYTSMELASRQSPFKRRSNFNRCCRTQLLVEPSGPTHKSNMRLLNWNAGDSGCGGEPLFTMKHRAANSC